MKGDGKRPRVPSNRDGIKWYVIDNPSISLGGEKEKEYYHLLTNGGEEKRPIQIFGTTLLRRWCPLEYLLKFWLINGESEGLPTIEVLEERDYKSGGQTIILLDPKLIETDVGNGEVILPVEIHEFVDGLMKYGKEYLVFVLDGIHEQLIESICDYDREYYQYLDVG